MSELNLTRDFVTEVKTDLINDKIDFKIANIKLIRRCKRVYTNPLITSPDKYDSIMLLLKEIESLTKTCLID